MGQTIGTLTKVNIISLCGKRHSGSFTCKLIAVDIVTGHTVADRVLKASQCEMAVCQVRPSRAA